MYDKVLDKLQIYEGEWKSHHFETGVKELISSIQEAYLDDYEEYLLKQYLNFLSICQRNQIVSHCTHSSILYNT